MVFGIKEIAIAILAIVIILILVMVILSVLDVSSEYSYAKQIAEVISK